MHRRLLIGLLVLPLACSNSGSTTDTGSGGSSATGGKTGTGGTTGTGGGGTTGTGGGATGGATGTGGGATGTGGGATGTGGAATGGATGTGGSAGAKGTGGATGTGGAAGAKGTGGATGTGGSAGAPGTGGATATGGAAGSAGPHASVLQHHNDAARDGLYVDSAMNVTGITMDTTFANATIASDKVYAQPLYLAGSGSTPDEVIVATEKNNVYAFNAATGAKVWSTASISVGTAVTTGLPCGNIATGGNSLGVTGTPVIDGTSRTIYLDAMTADTTATAKHMVHAINADTGAEVSGWPVDLNAKASSAGTMFDSLVQNQRAALTLLGGKVFVPFSGHVGDCQGYHGWVVGVTTGTSPAVSAWATRAIAGGIWGASGIASDGTSLYFATGNSKSSASAGPSTSSGDSNASNWGDSETVYKFPTGLTSPAPGTTTDYFVPANWVALDDADDDMGGTSPILVTVPGATPSNLVVALGKDDNAYLLDRANLGGMDATPLAKTKVANGGPIIQATVAYTTAKGTTYVVFKGTGSNCPSGTGGLTALKITAANPPTISTAWCGGPGTAYSPAVSQPDTTGANTVVWVVGNDNKLYALDGDLGTTLFTSTAMSAVQSIQTPIIANGRVFVASNSQVYAFKPN